MHDFSDLLTCADCVICLLVLAAFKVSLGVKGRVFGFAALQVRTSYLLNITAHLWYFTLEHANYTFKRS